MIRLVSVEVRSWRGLSVRLDDLAPDLNLVVGPNEAGKSRLFEALRFALFERHKGGGKEKERLLSWKSADPPWVSVAFEVHGEAYTIEKQFTKRPSALLVGGGETLRDSEAEARLAELLGFRRPKRGLTGDDERGLWPLVWLEQGSSGAAPHDRLNADTRGRLRDLLAKEVGEVAAGPKGQRILERAAEERGRFYTASGRETGALAEARGALADATATRDAARARRDEAHAAADALAGAREALGELGPRIEARRRSVKELRARAETLGRLEAEIRTARAERRGRESRLGEATADAARWRQVRADLDARGGERVEAEEARDALVAQAAEAAETAGAAEAKFQAADAAHRKADPRLRRARRALERHGAIERRAQIEAALEKARALADEIGELEVTAARLRVDPEHLSALEQLAGEIERAEAALAVAAARITVRASRDLVVDGEPLAGGNSRSVVIDAPRTVDLDGVAEIRVEPGGQDLARIREDLAGALDRRAALLEACGATTMAEVSARAAEAPIHAARLEARRERLDEIAPDGLEALEVAAREEAVAVEALSEHAPGDTEESPGTDPAEALRQAEEDLTTAAGERERLRTDRDAANGRLEALRREIRSVEERLERIAGEVSTLDARLADAPAKDALEAAVSEAQGALDAATEALAALERRFEVEGGERLADDLERETRALSGLEDQATDLNGRIRRLEGELFALGGEGLHEKVEEAEADVAHREAALAQILRRAGAARRLHGALTEARRAAQERLLAPVVARAAPYLQEVFPGSHLSLDEDWAVEGLRTGPVAEPLEELSGGAREQLGIVVRLALAEVLAGEGSLPVVLDDALVNTDAERREAMLRILYRAARGGLQILVMSCHAVAFDGLGATRTYVLDGPDRAANATGATERGEDAPGGDEAAGGSADGGTGADDPAAAAG